MSPKRPISTGRSLMSISDLLTPKEAAAYLRTTPKTLAVWRSTRRVVIAYVKQGRSIRYRLSDIEAFLRARKVG